GIVFLGALCATGAAHAQVPEPIISGDEPSLNIRLRKEADIVTTREELIRHVWRAGRITDLHVTNVKKTNAVRWPGLSLPADAVALELHQAMPHGVETTSYYLSRPVTPSCLMVFIRGHVPEIDDRSPSVGLLKRLLDGGCDLIVHAMPLLDGNNQPTVET